MNKLLLIAGTIYSLLGVGIGAFGAHALKQLLETTNRVNTFETAVKYQFYHAISLLLIGILSEKFDYSLLSKAGYCMIIGTFIFSGSIYIICLSNVSKWGAVTPIGGLLLIIGWAILLYALLK